MPLSRNKTDHNAFISPLLLSVVFGLAAGAVGTLLIAASAPNPGPLPSVIQPVSRVPGATNDFGVAPSASSSPSALVFRVKSGGTSVVDRAFLPSQAVGSAAVLTSDGWLLSTESVFTDAVRASLPSYRVVFDLVAYEITSAVADPFTGIVFLKVKGSKNFPVTSYRSGMNLEPGSSVFGFDAEGGPRKLETVGYGARPATTSADLVRSSERMQRVLRLSGSAGSVPSGSMIVDASGEAVAIFIGDDASGSTAVPFAAFSEQIGSVLRDGKVHRPYFGVRYVDQAHLLGIDEAGTNPSGATLTSSPDGRPAVQRKSPAEIAGLRAGDRVVRVNDEPLGAQTSLADLLAEYAPGSVVSIKARRGGAQDGVDIDASVTLGEVP